MSRTVAKAVAEAAIAEGVAAADGRHRGRLEAANWDTRLSPVPARMTELEIPLPSLPRGIWVNRTLNLRSIRAIGYDMDYTLVHYRPEAWESSRLRARQGRAGGNRLAGRRLRVRPEQGDPWSRHGHGTRQPGQGDSIRLRHPGGPRDQSPRLRRAALGVLRDHGRPGRGPLSSS